MILIIKIILFIIRLAPDPHRGEGIVKPLGNKGLKASDLFRSDRAMSAHPSAGVEKLPSVWLFAS